MIIIGEKINGTIPSVKRAIEEHNEEFIRNFAIKQVEAGADYLDICAGTAPEAELDTLLWLIDTVQNVANKPLCIDSPNPLIIEQVFKHANQCGIINSISAEGDKADIIYSMITGTDWQVIALTCDNEGIPPTVQKRVKIARILVEKAQKYNIALDRIHIDPLVIALSADTGSLLNFLETLKAVKELYPNIKVTSGLSNISFGMPLRKVINLHFLTLATYAGMDSVILDPCNQDITTSLMATEALLGRDRCCRNFNNAYREKRIGPIGSIDTK